MKRSADVRSPNGDPSNPRRNEGEVLKATEKQRSDQGNLSLGNNLGRPREDPERTQRGTRTELGLLRPDAYDSITKMVEDSPSE